MVPAVSSQEVPVVAYETQKVSEDQRFLPMLVLLIEAGLQKPSSEVKDPTQHDFALRVGMMASLVVDQTMLTQETDA